MLHSKIIYKYRDLIKIANEELSNHIIILKCLNRFVFQGSSNYMQSVDFIYFGDDNYGVYCSKNELANFVISRDYMHLETLHIVPMTIQPYLRDINNKSQNKYKRHKVQIKWHYLLTDNEKVNSLIKITNNKLKNNKYFNYFK